MSERTVVDLEITVPAERVWQALRDRAEIRKWFGWEHDGIEAEIEQIFFAGATADDEHHVLDTGDGVYVLTAIDDTRTSVRVARTTAATGPDDEIDAGWIRFTGQLRTYLETTL